MGIKSIGKKNENELINLCTYIPGQIIGQNFDSINPKSKAQTIQARTVSFLRTVDLNLLQNMPSYTQQNKKLNNVNL